MRLLEVTDLTVSFPVADGRVIRAVRGVSFGVDHGQVLGVVGGAGAGKSVAALTLPGLVRRADVSGRAVFDGRSLLDMAEPELRAIRGARIGMMLQDPHSCLHPHHRVGWQMVEAIRTHRGMPRQAAHRRAVDLLRLLGVPRPERRVDDYPHQFSGSLRRHAMLAMAVASDPPLLIADEPALALDGPARVGILTALRRLQRERGTAIIVLSRDPRVAEVADHVVVMCAGRFAAAADAVVGPAGAAQAHRRAARPGMGGMTLIGNAGGVVTGSAHASPIRG